MEFQVFCPQIFSGADFPPSCHAARSFLRRAECSPPAHAHRKISHTRHYPFSLKSPPHFHQPPPRSTRKKSARAVVGSSRADAAVLRLLAAAAVLLATTATPASPHQDTSPSRLELQGIGTARLPAAPGHSNPTPAVTPIASTPSHDEDGRQGLLGISEPTHSVVCAAVEGVEAPIHGGAPRSGGEGAAPAWPLRFHRI